MGSVKGDQQMGNSKEKTSKAGSTNGDQLRGGGGGSNERRGTGKGGPVMGDL